MSCIRLAHLLLGTNRVSSKGRFRVFWAPSGLPRPGLGWYCLQSSGTSPKGNPRRWVAAKSFNAVAIGWRRASATFLPPVVQWDPGVVSKGRKPAADRRQWGVGGPNLARSMALHGVKVSPGAGSLRAPIPEIQKCGPPACFGGGHPLDPNPVMQPKLLKQLSDPSL